MVDKLKNQLTDQKPERQKPERHKRTWKRSEELQLIREMVSGLKIHEIAEKHQRTPGAISARVYKMLILGEFHEKQFI